MTTIRYGQTVFHRHYYYYYILQIQPWLRGNLICTLPSITALTDRFDRATLASVRLVTRSVSYLIFIRRAGTTSTYTRNA